MTSSSARPKSRQRDEQLEDLRLHHHVERRRRLVRDQHARIACERDRDRRPLPHPAGELVREALATVARDADRLEQLRHAGPRHAAGRAVVDLERLDDLRTDRLHGVERVHRALEDDREVGPAVGADRLLAAGQDVGAVQEHAAGDRCARRQQAEQTEHRRGLAAAGLPDEAEPLPLVQRKAHPLDGVQLAAVAEVEPDVQILELEQRAHTASELRPTSGRRRKVRAPTATASSSHPPPLHAQRGSSSVSVRRSASSVYRTPSGIEARCLPWPSGRR